jgi:HEAT repeat protein
MKYSILQPLPSVSLGLLAIWLASSPAHSAPAVPGNTPAEKEQHLIAVLKSDAPTAEKAISCKFLSVYGSPASVPAIAPLLQNPELSSWARIPLEVIPGPAADDALRNALSSLEGRLLIGVIHSIGVRRDTQAIAPLIDRLKSTEVDVASAAALTLGKLGGDQAAKALTVSLNAPQPALRSAAAQGAILCAEQYLATGRSDDATRLYDAVRHAQLPKQRTLEALRGAILARGTAGIPVLLEQLQSSDRDLNGIALRTARELPGSDVSTALAAELNRSTPERQGPILLALADRTDDAVLPAVLELAKSAPLPLRTIAIGALDRMGNASCLPVLLEAAANDNAPLARAAKLAVVRLEDPAVDPQLLARLPASTGKDRQVLIELAGQRLITSAVPIVLNSAQDPDPGVRRAACDTLALLGGQPEAAQLAQLLLHTPNTRDQRDLERALASICGRVGTPTLANLLPLLKQTDPSYRMSGLRLLATVGGPDALAAVVAALKDPHDQVQDEAVRTLAAWPGNWPDDAGAADPLLLLAKSAQKPAHQIQGMRGYLQFIQETRTLNPAEKLSRVEAVLPQIQRTEEKRLAISALGSISSIEPLELLVHLANQEPLAEEACQAIVRIANNVRSQPNTSAARKMALQTVVERSPDEATRKRAQAMLNRP